MFAIYSLMGIPFERFELAFHPIVEPEPVVGDDHLPGGSPGESARRFGLISNEERDPHDELASLGLVKKCRGRDDLAFFGLCFLSPGRERERGV